MSWLLVERLVQVSDHDIGMHRNVKEIREDLDRLPIFHLRLWRLCLNLLLRCFNVCVRSCVSITLPASSYTRITASRDRLQNLAYPTASLTASGSPYHMRPNGSASLIRSTPRLWVGVYRRAWYVASIRSLSSRRFVKEGAESFAVVSETKSVFLRKLCDLRFAVFLV
jgi:hypothetical protein